MGRVAEAYARLGLRVIPLHHPTASGGCSCGDTSCKYPGKHPRTHMGVKDATSNIETIRAWWFSHPYSNVGLATGHLVDVIDIDSADGAAAIAALRSAQRLPDVLATATTGRHEGGTHIYIAATGAGCKPPPVKGVDFRGSRGYVVAAPSRHVSGAEYVWSAAPTLLGDPKHGHAFPLMPWENVAERPAPVGSRETNYARKMLTTQVAKVGSAPPGKRYGRVLTAANNLGSVVAGDWIRAQEVTEALLSAYQAAGGCDDAVIRAISSGLDEGRRYPLPDLGASFAGGDAREVVLSIRRWMSSPDFEQWKTTLPRKPSLTEPRLQVLRRILTLAEETGQTSVRMAVRDAQSIGGFASTDSAANALKALLALPVLSLDERRHRGTGAARKFRLHYPPGFTQDGDATEQDTVGVSEDSTALCSVASQMNAVDTHSLWGHARGRGRGLTRKDRVLFANVTAEADLPIKTKAWAERAGCDRASLQRACKGSDNDLIGLGLVAQVKDGSLALTPLGAALAAAVQGQGDLRVLDDLAEELGVSERKDRREQDIANARAESGWRLVFGYRTSDGEPKRGFVERLLSGWLASERVPVLLAQTLAQEPAQAASRICGALDLTERAKPIREAVWNLLTMVEHWTGDPWEDICEPDLVAAIADWLRGCPAVGNSNVDADLSALVAAWWRASHPQPDGEHRYDDGCTHRELVARVHIDRAFLVPRNRTPGAGYTRVGSTARYATHPSTAA